MTQHALRQLFFKSEAVKRLCTALKNPAIKLNVKGLAGSGEAFAVDAVVQHTSGIHILILPNRDEALRLFTDLEQIRQKGLTLFYPADSKGETTDMHSKTDRLCRAETLSRLSETPSLILLSYPEAICDPVPEAKTYRQLQYRLNRGMRITPDELIRSLQHLDYNITDYVNEPGQYAVRGGIVDVYSYASEFPVRIDFFGDNIDSIRTFHPATQLSLSERIFCSFSPDDKTLQANASIADYIPEGSVWWFRDFTGFLETAHHTAGKEQRCLLNNIQSGPVIELAAQPVMQTSLEICFYQKPQPVFNKNFSLLGKTLLQNARDGIKNLITAANQKQLERLHHIFEDRNENVPFSTLLLPLSEGFTDHALKIACYTDHQIFMRHHAYLLKKGFKKSMQDITVKEIGGLKKGDYITHIDHGIGKFDGLEKLLINGREKEALRILYKDNDILYVSIHSLHRIAKYTGRDGCPPKVHKLGSKTWNMLKQRTKKKVRELAFNLIELYAKRKTGTGYSFSPDTYLQNELEASFIYEDTPDQIKAIKDVKTDMESPHPMDRLICGDVGFGKTEIAIRAAFKAVADSKQVAVLVPTTILCMQHFRTFSQRLKDFPCHIVQLNRFITGKEQKKALQLIAEGKADIIIGTHRLLGKDVLFKDLGLLILDEEQKFGVSAKEKLRNLRSHIDTLTLTATPIPRTLQFSMMGARDLSIINTPPPNRIPINTLLTTFNEQVIRNAIRAETERGGQVFFVHNKIQNIHEVAGLIKRICPGISIAVAHGRMEGKALESTMMDFFMGNTDVLVTTSIIESGLDIPSANTIIVNDAHHYGLSDLHQLRGRVGRTNVQAFCFLLSPPLSMLSTDAAKRLRAIEQFSDLGSGFNIALRDLDIRGAGNLLGAEQSGFMADIGFDMYHKILDEAIVELKRKHFPGLIDKQQRTAVVKECVFETDLEILLPDNYVEGSEERLRLYREMNMLKNKEELQAFKEKLKDRFGALPHQAHALMETIRLRWMGEQLGFEKISLKNNALKVLFITDKASSYYESPVFAQIIRFIGSHPEFAKLKEAENKLHLMIPHISNTEEAIRALERLLPVQSSM